MIQQPVENLFLQTHRTMLLQDLSNLIFDKLLFKEIEEYACPPWSVKTIIADTLMPRSRLSHEQEEALRQRVTMQFPGALEKFNELAAVCNRIATLKSPVIVY